jgi:nicotinate phosphoribosyltransferase
MVSNTDGGVLEFGLRRAQGPDAGIYGARASIIGGCIATSNVLAGKMFDIPVKGTHSHSWVMSFKDELTSFRKYAELFILIIAYCL